MQHPPERPFKIRAVKTPAEVKRALELIAENSGSMDVDADSELMITQANAGLIDVKRLLIAIETVNDSNPDGEILGSILLTIQPDKNGLCWPPALAITELTEAELEGVSRKLVVAACKIAEKKACKHLQASLGPDQDTKAKSFLRSGFRELGNMVFMARSVNAQLPEDMTLGEDVQLVPFEDHIDDTELARLIDASYVESCDYPELQGERSGAEAIISHRSQGQYRPDWWYLIEVNCERAGVLFFTDHEEFDQAELVYLGIAKKFRRQGIGGTALFAALKGFDQEKRSVFLGVDSRNSEAISIYEQAGFEAVSVQRVFHRSCLESTE